MGFLPSFKLYRKKELRYPNPSGQQEWINFIDRWIDLKRKDQTIEQAYNYWILGKEAIKKRPRWSIIGNVLHWAK